MLFYYTFQNDLSADIRGDGEVWRSPVKLRIRVIRVKRRRRES